jgi:sacsin
MLAYFNILLVSDKEISRSIFQNFFQKHSENKNGIIYPLTGNDLIDTLNSSSDNLPNYSKKHYSQLLNYLSAECLSIDDEGLKLLKEISILPTRCGSLVSASEDGVYIPEADTPQINLEIKLVEYEQGWRILFSKLGIRKLSLPRLIRLVLNKYTTLELSAQLEILNWLRINLNLAIDELRKQGQEYKNFQKDICSYPLIYCSDGRLRPPTKTYHPNEKIVFDVLGGDAPIPDMKNVYSQDADIWLNFFENLGILRHPDPQDLLDHTERLLKKSQETSVNTVADACRALLYYVEENWEDLKNAQVLGGNSQKMPLPMALRNRRWLPMETDPSELRKYPGAENLLEKTRIRLCRPDELISSREVNLVASKRPLLRLKREPKGDVQSALGFKGATTNEVIEHFEFLLNWYNNSSKINNGLIEKPLEIVYRYCIIFDPQKGNVDAQEKRRFKERFENRQCLWNWNSEGFWKPEHVFGVSVAYYGKRRLGLGKHKFADVYHILGQRDQPTIKDHLDFIQEIYDDYSGKPIN